MFVKLLGYKVLLFGYNYLKDGIVGYFFGFRDVVKRGIRESGSVGILLERDILIGYWLVNELVSFGLGGYGCLIRDLVGLEIVSRKRVGG